MNNEKGKISWRKLLDFFKKSYKLSTVWVLVILISFSLLFILCIDKAWTDAIDKKMIAYAALYVPHVDREASRSVEDIKVILSEDASQSQVLEALRDIESIDSGFYLDFYTNKNLNILQILNNGEEVSQAARDDSFGCHSKYFYPLNLTMIFVMAAIAVSPLIINWFKLVINKKK